MGTKKIFYDSTANLQVFENQNKKCCLKLTDKMRRLAIELDSSDLTELITELQFIKKQIDNG
jgi:hypothetical protein